MKKIISNNPALAPKEETTPKDTTKEKKRNADKMKQMAKATSEINRREAMEKERRDATQRMAQETQEIKTGNNGETESSVTIPVETITEEHEDCIASSWLKIESESLLPPHNPDLTQSPRQKVTAARTKFPSGLQKVNKKRHNNQITLTKEPMQAEETQHVAKRVKTFLSQISESEKEQNTFTEEKPLHPNPNSKQRPHVQNRPTKSGQKKKKK